MKKSLLFPGISIGFLFFLVSCLPKERDGVVDLNDTGQYSVIDFFYDPQVVQLETGEDFMIADIRKVKYHNDRFYILDALSQQFFCFEAQGNFVFKISARGRGPGEYNFITDFTFDKQGESILILDPVVQRVLKFDLEGNYIETFSIPTERIMGFNQLFALNDSVILITSITNYQLVFFDLKSHSVVQKAFKFPIEGSFDAYSPRDNVYQLRGRTFVLPYLGRKFYDITGINPIPYFTWDFGAANNSDEQIKKLISKVESLHGNIAFHASEVGKGKLLNHHIVKVHETPRFKIAIIEYDNHFRHVIRDKKTLEDFVFNHFKEEISLVTLSIQSDVAIGFKTGFHERAKNYPYLSHRKFGFYNIDILSEADRQIIANHDPMTQNPFLVVYRFRE